MKATYTITLKTGSKLTIERQTRITAPEGMTLADAILAHQGLVRADADKVESFIDAAKGPDKGHRDLYISDEMVAREEKAARRRRVEYAVGHHTDRLLDEYADTIEGLRQMAERIEGQRNWLLAQVELPDDRGGWGKPAINTPGVGMQQALRAATELTVYLPQHLDLEDILREASNLDRAIAERDAMRREDEAR